jgi:hypothetical protein
LKAKCPSSVPDLEKLLRLVQVVPTVVDGTCPIPLPSKDVPILLSAIRAGCSHLLTGDLRHFGRFMNRPKLTAGIIIQKVSQFLSER